MSKPKKKPTTPKRSVAKPEEAPPYCGELWAGQNMQRALKKPKGVRRNDKVSYHADNAGGAHGKDTNDK